MGQKAFRSEFVGTKGHDDRETVRITLSLNN